MEIGRKDRDERSIIFEERMRRRTENQTKRQKEGRSKDCLRGKRKTRRITYIRQERQRRNRGRLVFGGREEEEEVEERRRKM